MPLIKNYFEIRLASKFLKRQSGPLVVAKRAENNVENHFHNLKKKKKKKGLT